VTGFLLGFRLSTFRLRTVILPGKGTDLGDVAGKFGFDSGAKLLREEERVRSLLLHFEAT